jgi:2,3-bisphosphoglycerate-dependent phosphoglycerate mutase
MKIIAVRHGETALNVAGRTTGWLDDPLTEKGKSEAVALADNLEVEFDVIVASPLLRALSTAELIATRHPRNIITDPNLRERNFGSLSGKTWSEIQQETGIDMRHRDIDLLQYDYRPFGGESAEDVTFRIRCFIASMSSLGSRGNVLAVTHGGIIKMMYSMLPWESRQPILNCSVHIFQPQLRGLAVSSSVTP